MNKTNGKLVLYAVMVLFGAGLIAFSIVHKSDGVYGGLGGGLAGAGVAQIIRILRFKNDKDYAKRGAVENADERNVYLVQKARGAAVVYGICCCIYNEYAGYGHFAFLCYLRLLGTECGVLPRVQKKILKEKNNDS